MTSHLIATPPSRLALVLAALRATKHTTPAQLSHWSAQSPATGLDEAHAALRRLIDADCVAPAKKGEPNTAALKRDMALDLDARLRASAGSIDAATLEAAHRFASLDMADRAAFASYVGIVMHANAEVLGQVRAALTANVVMHLSCNARIDRARESCASFVPAQSEGVSQIIVVGAADTHVYRFDAARGVLSVPAPDTYEHLPAKVIGAMFLFALCGNVDAVLKVDDDHRLHDGRALMRGFARVVAKHKHPVQMGIRNNIGVLGNHLRVWHFGKCADPALNPKPFTLPGTTRWINGAGGYFVNRAALRLLFWSHIYFPDYIRIGLYEDMTVSDLLERQGARLVSADMSSILGTVGQY